MVGGPKIEWVAEVPPPLGRGAARSRPEAPSTSTGGPPTQLDGQQIGLIGRNLLVVELVRDGLEVAIPVRDRGIDLIAYVDALDEPDAIFVARPIQLKARIEPAFEVWQKWGRLPGLLVVYLWHVGMPAVLVAYCLTYPEALEIAQTMGWIKTPTWATKLHYRMNTPSARLRELLEPHRMGPGKWRAKVLG